eukprot:Amastigsp_a2276_21.p7 type:complete len:107 gc:universal Amastigsp_a2276_21:1465-1145(-)
MFAEDSLGRRRADTRCFGAGHRFRAARSSRTRCLCCSRATRARRARPPTAATSGTRAPQPRRGWPRAGSANLQSSLRSSLRRRLRCRRQCRAPGGEGSTRYRASRG